MTASAAPALSPAQTGKRDMGFKQFVALIAALMAVNALAIDSMLPALPAMAHALGVTGENKQQWIVTAYLMGFGATQIIYGPLADRFGRKPILVLGLSIYVVFSFAAAFSTTMPVLIAARVMQGVGAAATRVLAVSVVRDRYTGSQMARVMSLSFIVFLAVPILAPSIGQIIMLFGPWRLIFGGLTAFGTAVLVWTVVRLPETLHPEDRLAIEPRRVLQAFRLALTNRIAVGYMVAMTFVMGSLFGFINSAQQIFAETFAASRWFTTIFALIAAFMALSSFLNSRIVGRLGTRRLSHMALVGFIGCSGLHALLALTGLETIWSFAILQASVMFCFGLVVSNFGSIAMGPLGHIAGTASSVQGFVTTFGGAVLGFFLGQHFDGTVIPLTLGFTAYGVLALLAIVVAEKGRLFQPHANPATVTDAGGVH
jgi:DHA1 family bicyclomycin/chloramphenicol resistance-like MFS transporter